MTMLKLREGWEVETDSVGRLIYKRVGADSLFAYVIEGPFAVRAYPHGDFDLYYGRVCETIEEAHAYLIESGSESPWEEVS